MKLDRAYERIRIFGLEHEHNYRQKLGITTEFYDFSEALQFKNFADGKYYQPEIVSPETGERIGNKRVNKCYPGFKANPQTLTCEPQRDESAPEPQSSIFRPESIFKKMGGRSDATSPAVTPTAEDLPDTTIKRIDITNWESVKTPGARKSMFDRILELDGKEQLKAALEVTSTLEEAKEFIKARQREADSPNERSVKIKNDFAYQGKSLKWYAHDRGSDISPQHLFTVQKFWGEPKLFPDNIYFITKDKFVIDKLNGSLIYRGVMDSDGKPKYRDEQGVLRSDDQYNACPIGRNNGSEFSDNSEECKIVYEETNTGRGLKADINEQLKDKEISQDHQAFIDSQTQPENQNINLDALKKFIIEEVKYNREGDKLRESRLGEKYEGMSYLEAAFKSFIGEKSGNKNVELTYPGSIVDEDYSDIFGVDTDPARAFNSLGDALKYLGGFLDKPQMYVEVKDGLFIEISRSGKNNQAQLNYIKSGELNPKGLIITKDFIKGAVKAERGKKGQITEPSKRLFVSMYIQDLLNNNNLNEAEKIEGVKDIMLKYLSEGRLKQGSEYDPNNENKSKALVIYEDGFILPADTLADILRIREARFNETNAILDSIIEKFKRITEPSLGNKPLFFTKEEIKRINENLPEDKMGKEFEISDEYIQGQAQKYISTSAMTQKSKNLKGGFVALFSENELNEELIKGESFRIYNANKVLTDSIWKSKLIENTSTLIKNIFMHLVKSKKIEIIERIPILQEKGFNPDDSEENIGKKIEEINNIFISELTTQLQKLEEIADTASVEKKEDEINKVFNECLILFKNAGISRGLSGLSELHAICLASVDVNTNRIIIPDRSSFEMYDFFVQLKRKVKTYQISLDSKTGKVSLVRVEKGIESYSVKMPGGNLASAYTGFKSLGITKENNPLTTRPKKAEKGIIFTKILPSKNTDEEGKEKTKQREKTKRILKGKIRTFKGVLERGSTAIKGNSLGGFENIDNFLKNTSKEVRGLIIALTSLRLDSEIFQDEFLKDAYKADEENPMHFEDFLAKAFVTSCADIQGLRSNLSQILIDYRGEADPNSPRKAKKVKALDQRAYADLNFIDQNGEILEVVSTAKSVEDILKRLTALNIKIKRKTSSWGYNYKQDPQSDDVSIRTFSENLSKVIK